MSCFTNSIVSLMSPLRPSFDKRLLLPLLSAFFPTLCVFLLSLDISLLPFALSAVFSAFCTSFSLSAEMLSLLSSGDFFCFSLLFFCFLCFSSSGETENIVMPAYLIFILVSSFRCTLTVTDSMRASTMMSNISMKISQPISPPFRFGVRTVLR